MNFNTTGGLSVLSVYSLVRQQFVILYKDYHNMRKFKVSWFFDWFTSEFTDCEDISFEVFEKEMRRKREEVEFHAFKLFIFVSVSSLQTT